MNICIDTRSPGQTGILSYMNRLLDSLLRIDKENNYIILTDPEHNSWGFDNIEEIVVPSLNPLRWIIWSNTILPKLLKEKKVDIYHSLKHITAFRLKTKKIVTLHGVHMHYIIPSIFKRQETLYWKLLTYLAAKNYDRIITVALGEKNYLVDNLGYPENKFRVTYLSGDERFRVINDKQEKEKVKSSLNLPDHFILYVGMIHPRKNLEGVINGFHQAKDKLNVKYKLVIAGDNKGEYYRELRDLVTNLNFQDEVIFLGRVSDEDLPNIYNLADLFLFPSHYEGFGIVLMEAMACGIPVITSNIEDICEVVGDAAILVNPTNTSEIADSIIKVLNNAQVKQTLAEKGLGRSKLFSWDNCARETLKIYKELGELG